MPPRKKTAGARAEGGREWSLVFVVASTLAATAGCAALATAFAPLTNSLLLIGLIVLQIAALISGKGPAGPSLGVHDPDGFVTFFLWLEFGAAVAFACYNAYLAAVQTASGQKGRPGYQCILVGASVGVAVGLSPYVLYGMAHTAIVPFTW